MPERSSRQPFEHAPSDIVAEIATVMPEVDNNLGSIMPRDQRRSVATELRRPRIVSMNKLATELAFDPDPVRIESVHSQSTAEAGQDVVDALKPSLATAMAIDKVKIATRGQEASTEVENAIVTSIMARSGFAVGLRSGGSPDTTNEVFAKLMSTADLLMKQPGRERWFAAKIINFAFAYSHGSYFRAVEKSLEGSDAAEHTRKDAETNEQLFDASQRLRAFGLKQAILPGVAGDLGINEWQIYEPDDFYTAGMDDVDISQTNVGFTQEHNIRNTVAVFAGVQGSFKSTGASMQVLTEHDGTAAAFITGPFDGELEEGAHIQAVMALGQNGNVVNVGSADFSYEDLAKKHRTEAAYRLVQSELIGAYSDSVVPVYIADLVQRSADGMFPERSDRPEHDRTTTTGFRRLQLARTRIIQTEIDNMEAEGVDIDAGIDPTEIPERILARHGVVNHIRPIAMHAKASPKQRAECLEDWGIELAKYGETYVGRYFRGSLRDESDGHRAVYTTGTMAKREAQD